MHKHESLSTDGKLRTHDTYEARIVVDVTEYRKEKPTERKPFAYENGSFTRWWKEQLQKQK